MDSKQKYLKYKNKYLRLKKIYEEQHGGANNPNLDLRRYDNKYIQEQIKEKCLLTKPNLDIRDRNNLSFSVYTRLLKDLMNYGSNESRDMINNLSDDEINIHFLNTISAFPLDLTDTLNIQKRGEAYEFQGPSNYTIDSVISAGTTGSKAIILKLKKKREAHIHESLPQDLVLKLMPINFSSYYNYTPLAFQHISERSLITLTDPRYHHYTLDKYRTISLDENYQGYNHINGREQLHITAADLDDFKNEMVQNIICKTILPEDNDTLIENYNYIYINFNGRMYGGILMESLEGSLDTYIHRGRNKEAMLTNYIFSNALVEYLDTLALLKTPQHRFNHSDLKIQNIFYALREDGSIKLKLADLDKSSITYNGVRFINGRFINKKIDTKVRIPITVFDRGEENYVTINKSLPRYAGIEVDQLYLRYGFFPPPPFYDILMLFIGLRAHFYEILPQFLNYSNGQLLRVEEEGVEEEGEGVEEEVYQDARENPDIKDKIESYIPGDIDIHTITRNIQEAVGRAILDAGGDFGTIVLRSLVDNQIPIPLGFTDGPMLDGDIIHRNVSLSNRLKLVLVEPKIYNNLESQTKFWGLFFTSSKTWKSIDGENYIFYTGNSSVSKDLVVKTSRYTSSSFFLYEWDKPRLPAAGAAEEGGAA